MKEIMSDFQNSKTSEEMRIGMKKCLKWVILGLILILPILVLGIIKNNYVHNDVAGLWSLDGDSSHIGVYISSEKKFSVTDIMKFRDSLSKKLEESNVNVGENGNNTWTDGYCAKAQVKLSRDNTESNITAYGVGSDFFIFHPFDLVDGSYFTEENVARDLVLLDEDTAWRFFGSTNIAGMEIEINGKKHIVSGVIKRDDAMFEKATGYSKPAIYMSYESLSTLEEGVAITSYEIVMPNLTKDYAKKIVKETIDIDSSKCEIVEYTDRYTTASLINVIKDFGKRSMQTKSVIYPYWENEARGIEDICAAITFLMLVMYGITGLYIIILVVVLILRNKEIIKEKFVDIKGKISDKMSKNKMSE